MPNTGKLVNKSKLVDLVNYDTSNPGQHTEISSTLFISMGSNWRQTGRPKSMIEGIEKKTLFNPKYTKFKPSFTMFNLDWPIYEAGEAYRVSSVSFSMPHM